jgi:hypothetical protein
VSGPKGEILEVLRRDTNNEEAHPLRHHQRVCFKSFDDLLFEVLALFRCLVLISFERNLVGPISKVITKVRRF